MGAETTKKEKNMSELKQLQDIQDEMREGYAPEVVPTFHGGLHIPNSIAWSDYDQAIKAVTQRFRGYVDKARSERDEVLKELSQLRWTPITDRMPTVGDANEYHDVEWSDGTDRWDNQFYTPNMGNRKATHWRRIVLP